jgi:hypothetical protein
MVKKFVVYTLTAIVIVILCASNAEAMSATVSMRESEVYAGDSVYVGAEIKWPENYYRRDLIIEYSIKDANDNEIAYTKVLRAIETQISFEVSITIPESTKGGIYQVDVTISDYEELNYIVSTSFKVIEKSKFPLNIYLISILAIAVAIIILLVIHICISLRYKKH